LESTYKAYEEESYKKLSSVISGQKVLPAALFGDMLVGPHFGTSFLESTDIL
jgi:hypothetical protein